MQAALASTPLVAKPTVARSSRRSTVAVRAQRDLWFPGAASPAYLDGSMAGDRGFDPMGLGANPKMMTWYRQAELQNGRWAMLGVAGILGQEIINPAQWWYTAGMPENLPRFDGQPVNMGGILAWEFLLMHFVEVRRWQDIRKKDSVNADPFNPNLKVPNPELGYPGGPFDPLGFSKGNFKEAQTKEIKNGRLAMIAFAAFTIQAQATGKGPLQNLTDHLSAPFSNNWTTNIGHCMVPTSVDVQGLTIPLSCLWPGQQMV
ncbi:light-harvesting of photosystem I [Chlorella sorokiniana]|jgi:light-harvesting complex I chlorophyll a/b binding protein 4|uniref:Chlorophyll a-b binding protein, chloroplastic n=1 Tax=Chlorella sorokiniana TaxID=3076 RepID=A0A2P6U4K1_CHLSO|nr:light-harvesting of photosystem I [Chlorella sorokiniana]|eukprot:PRW61250.1 light-harvesting of photosystem I [Chlorella sorokiniana]